MATPPNPVLSRINSQNGQVQYQLQDSNGFPLPYFGGGMNYGANCGMTYGANWGMGMAPMAPACPPAAGSLSFAIVGDKVQPDKWTEYKADCGTPFFHNPGKNETTWEKPEDFDKQENAGNPPPPTEPKPEKTKKGKYESGRPSCKSWIL